METWFQTSLESPIPLWPESVISLAGKSFVLLFCFCLLCSALLFSFIKLRLCLVVVFLFRIQKCQNALSSSVKMHIPHSNAFIDLNKDFTAGESAYFYAAFGPRNHGCTWPLLSPNLWRLAYFNVNTDNLIFAGCKLCTQEWVLSLEKVVSNKPKE